MNYWQKEVEILDRSELVKLQFKKLKHVLEIASFSDFYSSALKLNGKEIDSYESVRELPLTTKEDLRASYPYGFLTVKSKKTVRLHCSSGTTGNPTVIFHSKEDLDSWANLVARSLYAAGVREDDVFQNICGYGLFTGGLGFQYGAERLGALVIPAAAGNSRRQIKLMRDFGTTVIHTIPSYLSRLYAVFAEMGLEPSKDTKLRRLIIGAEPHSEETRQRIQQLYKVKAYNSYGLSEMNGPGVAFECEQQNGLHLWEDSFLAEILDPVTLEPVAEGEQGELVLTTLDRQAMPIIRYRTRDLTRFLPGTCPCGRTHRRIDRIIGRSDDMMIIKGCNVFPIQIERVLMQIPEVGQDYLIVLDTIDGADEMLIRIEVHQEWFTGDLPALARLEKRIAHLVRDEILLTPKVKLVEPGALPKSDGKAVRVQDHRTATVKIP